MYRLAASLLAFLLPLLVGAQCLADVILTGAGATFPHPLYKKWIDVYQADTGVRVAYRAVGSGMGIKLLVEREVDFGATDAFLSDAEEHQAPAAILHLPTCVGAVAIIYHLPLNADLKLTPDCLADIFLGRIRKWSDPKIAAANPALKLPNIDITLVHRSDSSGTTFILTDYLSRVSSRWSQQIGAGKTVQWPGGLGVEGNPGVAQFVARIPGSIGYVQTTYARNMNLPFAAVGNRSGRFIKPSLQSVSAAAKVRLPSDGKVLITDSPAPDGYPISAFTYLIFYREQSYHQRDMNKAESLARFLWWVIHDGQAHNEGLFYARLPAEAVARGERMIRSMTYEGGPIAIW